MSPSIGILVGGLLTVVLFTGQAFAVGDEPVAAPTNGVEQRYAQAVQLIEQQQFDNAVGMLERITRDDPTNADAWNWLGFASRKNGDFGGSEQAYDTALTLDPNHKGALEYQGELRLEQDNLAAAEGNLAKLQRLCPAGCEERDDLARAIHAYKTTVANPAATGSASFY